MTSRNAYAAAWWNDGSAEARLRELQQRASTIEACGYDTTRLRKMIEELTYDIDRARRWRAGEALEPHRYATRRR